MIPTIFNMIRMIEQGAAAVGGLTKLAVMLGVKHQTFYSWTRVPAERVLRFEEVTGIPRHELRPDIYPAPAAAAGAAG